jgi:hypothetical protein
MTAKDILLAVIIPLILAEFGPWCGWFAARLLPWAAKLRYGDTKRAAVRLEEWSGDLNDIPGQLTKLAYVVGQLAVGSGVSVRRKARSALRETETQSCSDSKRIVVEQPVDLDLDAASTALIPSLDLLQRAGRVNRYSGQGKSEAAVGWGAFILVGGSTTDRPGQG